MEVFWANGHVKMDLVSVAETPTVHRIKDCVMSDTVDCRVWQRPYGTAQRTNCCQCTWMVLQKQKNTPKKQRQN